MSHIAIIGATGRVGSHLLEEALRRGHTVTAIARDSSKLIGRAGINAISVDIEDSADLRDAVRGADAVFSAARFTGIPPSAIIDPVKAAGVPRLLVVGGAGSLYVTPTTKLIETSNFPTEYKAEAEAGGFYLDTLRGETNLDWTFLSPSALFIEGPRTGQFRLGANYLLVDLDGKSWITFADYAIAFLDEFEQPQHSIQRFTVGY